MITRQWRRLTAAAVLIGALVAGTAASASAYVPVPGLMYHLADTQPCLKSRGNCVVYPKATQLPNGRLVASFEHSTVASSGTAVGQTLPVWKSDDHGTSWQKLSDVQAPAYLSSDPAVAPYVSAWTNPYLYVLPQAVGSLPAGTLLLAAVVSGDDEWYKEQKAADPNFVPNQDGDRSNMAIALYSSGDGGATWAFRNIITTGGWSSGKSNANTTHQNDPVWEPFLMVYNNQLVAYYSDESEYTGFDPTTGIPTLYAQNSTAADPGLQVLLHRTWDGTSAAWSAPVVDVPGETQTINGVSYIGNGRPGMTTVAQMADGKWIMTFEYFWGGFTNRYVIADDPLNFRSVAGTGGTGVSSLPVTGNSGTFAQGGSPVLLQLPNGRVAYNAPGSRDIWVNSGGSTSAWTRLQTTMNGAYSRNMTYDAETGRVILLTGYGQDIYFSEVDLGGGPAQYYQLVNRKTGQVIGTTDNITDANIGNSDVPDIRLESAGSASNPATQAWQIVTKADGTVALLNRAGGRSAAVWTGSATAGQRIGQWVDDSASGPFRMYTKWNGDVYFQSIGNSSLYLTGNTAGASLTLEVSDYGAGAQDWQLVPVS